ncbi:MAG: glycosyltransferase family 4 protein [Fimbriimonadaceae bacterium]|nr:glycosyltransferase family 4 protein [Fimbriimonadaceae bacterium]
MRIMVHDFGGHAFTATLSRELARRGHTVAHCFSGSFLTPQGSNQVLPDDPDSLTMHPIVLIQDIDKSDLRKRHQGELEHGRGVIEVVREFKPDVILSGNGPLDVQRMLLEEMHQRNGRFVFWVQDLVGQAAVRLLKLKIPFVGGIVGGFYLRMEQRLLEKSDEVVVISNDFRAHIPPSVRVRAHVIENWGVLEDLPLHPRGNRWRREQELGDGLVFLYSGTLGMKHNPELLVQMAVALKEIPDAKVVVISGGAALEYLQKRVVELGLHNLKTMSFQPFERLPEVLATADVLMAVLEPDAGVFSVPSKVLSYLCAGRPMLTAMPLENLAARTIQSAGAGVVVDPKDVEGFVAAGLEMAKDQSRREAMGAAGRSYAERTFDVKAIADRFEPILKGEKPATL